MSETQQYLAVVTDEPIAGVPSTRVYGPFPTSADALAALASYNLPSYCTTGYLLLRGPEQIALEVVR